MKIFKYSMNEKGIIELPVGAQVLQLSMQGNLPTVWAAVDPLVVDLETRFYIMPTGAVISPRDLERYFTTFSNDKQDLVWHVFKM